MMRRRSGRSEAGWGNPTAREHGLVIEELGEEILVYDLATNEAHCLTPLAAQVWRACDGRRSVAAISQSIAGEAQGNDAEQTARQAVEELGARGLLTGGLPRPAQGHSWSRREVFLRAGGAGATAALAAPLVKSIVAPTPAQAQTSCCGGRTCQNNGDCNTCPSGCRKCTAGFCGP